MEQGNDLSSDVRTSIATNASAVMRAQKVGTRWCPSVLKDLCESRGCYAVNPERISGAVVDSYSS